MHACRLLQESSAASSGPATSPAKTSKMAKTQMTSSSLRRCLCQPSTPLRRSGLLATGPEMLNWNSSSKLPLPRSSFAKRFHRSSPSEVEFFGKAAPAPLSQLESGFAAPL
eukprot:6186758-Pleurochrysis_carterae.AAC.1